MPRVVLTRRQIVLFAVFILSGIAFFYFVLPKLDAAWATTVHRIEHGDKWWIAIGVVLEGCPSPATSCCSAQCS